MRLNPDRGTQAARYCALMLQGERMACECARWQSRRHPDPRARRFLRAQLRQESFHARLFKSLALTLDGRRARAVRSRALDAYQRRLRDAMGRGDLIESLVGQQLVLEGLGHAALRRFGHGVPRWGPSLRRIGRRVQRQEHAHHAFGRGLLEREFRSHPEAPRRLIAIAADYLVLCEDVVSETGPVIEAFGHDPLDYLREVRGDLPDWVVTPP